MATLSDTYKILALLLALFILDAECSDLSQDALPQICDTAKCPPLSEITCPPDSSIREIFHTVEQGQINNTASPTSTIMSYNNTEIDEELYAECCLAKKCLCKTCYLPDCHDEAEVLVELLPESMLMPGHCCGEYECQPEPNCTAVGDTDYHWLTDCQRCRCFSGKPICHQSCDEAITSGGTKTKAICNSKALNQFFEHGESWKIGCYECECVNGEEKCVLPFCRSINCPPERQVTLKDSCCPICWPEGAPMPNEVIDSQRGSDKDDSELHIYDDENDEEEKQEESVNENGVSHSDDYNAENEIDTLPNIPFEGEENVVEGLGENKYSNVVTTANPPTRTTIASSTSTNTNTGINTTTTTYSQTTHAPAIAGHLPIAPISVTSPVSGVASAPATATACPPAVPPRVDTPATYQVYPEVVEVVPESRQNEILYIVIGALGVFVVVLLAWNIHLRSKQRSYRPVSHIDDNFNKMSCNIKATNDYV